LQPDYQSLSGGDRDSFEQSFLTMLANNFGEAFTANSVRLAFHQIHNSDVCVANVNRSSELQFLEQSNRNGKKSNKLYARIGNSSREIPPEKIPEYLTGRL